MKAAVCREFGKPLVIEEVELDSPGLREVRVRVSACAICHSDISYADGIWGGDLPAVYGHEAAGTVMETGSEAGIYKAGDRVIVTLIRHCGSCFFCRSGEQPLCEGHFALSERSPIRNRNGEMLVQGLKTAAFAEEVLVDVSQVARVPDEIPLDSASLLACGVITGAGAVINTAGFVRGSSAVVIGCGGVGLNCIQGAKISGAEPLIAVDLNQGKLQTALSFGASHSFSAVAPGLEGRVRELTEGRGADYVFVSVGSIAAMEQGVGLLRRAGTLVIAGMTGIGEKLPLEALDISDNTLQILGSKMGSTDPQRDIPIWVDHYLNGRLKLDELISGRYPLEEINDAIASVREGSTMRNVIVFD